VPKRRYFDSHKCAKRWVKALYEKTYTSGEYVLTTGRAHRLLTPMGSEVVDIRGITLTRNDEPVDVDPHRTITNPLNIADPLALLFEQVLETPK
jgi:hypothetical protein